MKVLTALIVGLAAGTALGMLFAPEKGDDTRDKLSESLKNLGDSIKDRAASEIDKMSGLKDTIFDKISSKVGGQEAPQPDDLEHA